MRGGEGVLVRFLGLVFPSSRLHAIHRTRRSRPHHRVERRRSPLCLLVSLLVDLKTSGREIRVVDGAKRVLRWVEWSPRHDVSVFDCIVPLFPLDLYALEFFGMMFHVVHLHLGKVAVYVGTPSAMSRSLVTQAPPRVYSPSIVQV